MRVTLGGQEHIISAKDETTKVRVDRHIWHEWKRADTYWGEDLVVVEKIDS